MTLRESGETIKRENISIPDRVSHVKNCRQV